MMDSRVDPLVYSFFFFGGRSVRGIAELVKELWDFNETGYDSRIYKKDELRGGGQISTPILKLERRLKRLSWEYKGEDK